MIFIILRQRTRICIRWLVLTQVENTEKYDQVTIKGKNVRILTAYASWWRGAARAPLAGTKRSPARRSTPWPAPLMKKTL